jgi:ribosomal protein L37AE/L43A
MWILIVAFLIAVPLMFVHPGMVLSLFWLGLVLLGAASVVGWVIVRAREAGARHSLKLHKCPHCHKEIQPDPQSPGEWHCRHCGANYLSSGIEQQATPSSS